MHHLSSPARVCLSDPFRLLALGLPHPNRFLTSQCNFIHFLPSRRFSRTYAPDVVTITHHHPFGQSFCRMAPVPLPTHQFPSNNSAFSSNFIDFSPNFRFSRTRTPNLVITTHPGLPSPSTIDWPNIPPTRWPQCHSLLLSPLFYQFLLISHPIRPSVRLSVCPSVRHISAHLFTNSVQTPSVHLTQFCPHLPVWAWSPLTHPSVHHLHLDSDQLCPGSVPSSIHPSAHRPIWDLSPVCLLSPLGDFHVC